MKNLPYRLNFKECTLDRPIKNMTVGGARPFNISKPLVLSHNKTKQHRYQYNDKVRHLLLLCAFSLSLSLGILQSALKFEYHQSSMSKMKPDRKPPLAKSPIRLRPRRVLGSNSNCMPTPAGRSEIGFEQTDKILTGLVFRFQIRFLILVLK